MWRIWTGDNAGRIMRIPLTDRVTSAPGRIFFFSVCLGDRGGFSGRLFSSFARYAAYARVRALRVQGCAENTQRNRDRRQNFQRFHFHRLFLIIFRSHELRRMLTAANSKKI